MYEGVLLLAGLISPHCRCPCLDWPNLEISLRSADVHLAPPQSCNEKRLDKLMLLPRLSCTPTTWGHFEPVESDICCRVYYIALRYFIRHSVLDRILFTNFTCPGFLYVGKTTLRRNISHLGSHQHFVDLFALPQALYRVLFSNFTCIHFLAQWPCQWPHRPVLVLSPGWLWRASPWTPLTTPAVARSCNSMVRPDPWIMSILVESSLPARMVRRVSS